MTPAIKLRVRPFERRDLLSVVAIEDETWGTWDRYAFADHVRKAAHRIVVLEDSHYRRRWGFVCFVEHKDSVEVVNLAGMSREVLRELNAWVRKYAYGNGENIRSIRWGALLGVPHE